LNFKHEFPWDRTILDATSIWNCTYTLVFDTFLALPYRDCTCMQQYFSGLAKSSLIILFLEMLKFSKIISSKSKNIVKENSGCLGIFHLLK
jgi:hypothetical protein